MSHTILHSVFSSASLAWKFLGRVQTSVPSHSRLQFSTIYTYFLRQVRPPCTSPVSLAQRVPWALHLFIPGLNLAQHCVALQLEVLESVFAGDTSRESLSSSAEQGTSLESGQVKLKTQRGRARSSAVEEMHKDRAEMEGSRRAPGN